MSSSELPVIWHPFTQHALEPDMLEIARSDGAYLITSEGRKIFDAISSWWVVTHGHRHPRIVSAIQETAQTLDQIIFAGLTHKPAEDVARHLIRIVPAGLAHVFFSDSGSTAIEVALKMALGFWRNRGERRTRILALEHGYHGDTVGTMSVGARGVFNAAYEPLLFEVTRIPFVDPLPALEAACRRSDTAAFICEPLVLGAGGMLMYDPETLRDMHAICRRHGVLFIADEVMTGFGRTGTLFACEQAAISPDILCLAKGLTGGVVPLAATLSTREIFEAHYDQDRSRQLFHSSSFTANPICCAAARANLEIWQDEPVLARVAALAAVQARCATSLRRDNGIENIRTLGTIAAFDVKVRDPGYLSNLALALRSAALKRDCLIRPLGNTIYVMPPYCSTEDDLSRVYDAMAAAIGEVAV